MKKILVVMLLLFCIIASVTSGTIAIYSKTVAPVQGSVSANRFIINTSTQTKNPNDSIMPGQDGSWDFSVVNFNGENVNEVNMDMNIRIDLSAASDSKPIDGLKVALKDDNGLIGEYIVKSGYIVINFEKAFPANIKKVYNFKLYYIWENGLAGDSTDYNDFEHCNTSKISVSVSGTQCLHDNPVYTVKVIDYYSEGVQKGDDPVKLSAIWLYSENFSNTLRRSVNKHVHTLQIYACVAPFYAAEKGVVWSVDDPELASIDQNGLLQSKDKTGVVTVIATAKDGSGVKGTLEIWITKKNYD